MTLAVFRPIGAARLGTGIAAHEISSSLLFWALLSVTGLCGGLINISTFLAIKLTSPLSFLITGISKVNDGLSLVRLRRFRHSGHSQRCATRPV